MSTSGALDTITIDALRIIKRYKEKYSDQDVASMMVLTTQNINTLSQADREKLKEFAEDFNEYIHAVKVMKLPEQAKTDNRSIEERFPEFAAALTYQAPKSSHPQAARLRDSSKDDNDFQLSKRSHLKIKF